VTTPLREAGREVRVLIVDDSVFMRRALERQLNNVRGVEVVGTANDGVDGVKRVLELRPDVVTMDVEMPRMDGVSAVAEIMQTLPTPVVMVSTLTREGADVTLRALEAGAVDYVAKPSGLSKDMPDLGAQLGKAVLNATHARVKRRPPRTKPEPSVRKPVAKGLGGDGQTSTHVVVIGSSTGGPPALTEVVPGLPADLGAGVVIVQHMPAGFTGALARRLNTLSALEVREAEPGDLMRDGVALIAPGDYHLTLRRGGRISLNQDPSRHGVRPSVDVTLESAERAYGRNTSVAILTGMGRDGASGAALIEKAGGEIVVQDEPSCVVYGMPRVTLEETQHAKEEPLERIATAITRGLKRAV
jgi:two-component system, chemotaxis family, protein-glutamate methylesterase/glutaminase